MSKRDLLVGLILGSIPLVLVGEFAGITNAAWRLGGWPCAASSAAVMVAVAVGGYCLLHAADDGVEG